jgi:hypothetical protein
MNNLSFITRFLLSCAGVDFQTIMQTTSSEINKYKIMGTCVLLPAMMALFSGYYAMYLISQSLWISLSFAPFWAMIIFILDRAVVSGTRPGRISFGVLGRIVLAVIIAFTISEPFILSLFSDTIEDKRVFVISEKQKHASTEFDEQIEAIKNKSNVEKTKVEDLHTSYIQEVDGTGGSKVAYRGPIAKIKEEAYLNALGDYKQNELVRQQKISLLEEKKEDKRQLVQSKDADGFLGNMVILGQLGKENSTVWWATWLICLLFLCIELIPILMKLGDSKDKDLYHDIQDMNDDACLELRRSLSGEWKELRRMECVVAIEADKERLLSQSIKNTLDWKLKDYEYFIEKISVAKDKHLKLVALITEKVEEGGFKEKLLAQLSNIYDGYIETLETLVTKSKQCNWETKTNSI